MRVIALRSLLEFWARHPDAEQALKAWYAEAKHGTWMNTAGVKRKYGTASIVDSQRVVFNVCGNKYRLIAAINYDAGIVFIKFIGTHDEYDNIDAGTVEWTPRSSGTKPSTKPRSTKSRG
jgi:mRNA interferase HigB